MSKKEKSTPDETIGIVMDIPEDEIWTYQVPGLAAPRVGIPPKNYTVKKILLACIIVVAVSLSCYFSIRTVQKDTFEYENITEEGCQLSKFSNSGYITELNLDYYQTLVYDEDNPDVNTNFSFVKDETLPITSIREYAFNGDEKLTTIHIGAQVTQIDSKSFYSCWNLEYIDVDDNNPNYCDIDGVLYNKDVTELICYPINHDYYLSNQYNYSQYDENNNWHEPEGEEYERYYDDVCTYVLPSTVTKIGDLAMNYTFIKALYVPEGLKTIGTLGLFKMTSLENIYTYISEAPVESTDFTTREALGEVYLSLPEGLEYIGSDAFTQNQSMRYMYIPESVTYIGHHAFWNTCFNDDNSETGLNGITQMNIARDEASFAEVKAGNQWRPVRDWLLVLFKSIDSVYEAERADIE